jgi:hypothetical protein
MQHAKNITVHMLDAAGFTLGVLYLPAGARLADLNHLRALGATRLQIGTRRSK